jgi:hypothetical protein
MTKKKTRFPKNFFSISFKYGIFSALIMAVLTFIFYMIIGSASRPVLVWNYIILLLMMYFSVKEYRNKLKGYISFKECYISGLFFGLTASILVGVFVYINTKYIDKQLISNFIAVNETAMRQYISGEELIKQQNILYRFSSPIFMGFRAMGELTLMSLFLPLLMSILLKKEKRIKESNESTND